MDAGHHRRHHTLGVPVPRPVGQRHCRPARRRTGPGRSAVRDDQDAVRQSWGDVVGWSGLAKVAPNPQVAADLIRQRLDELHDEVRAVTAQLDRDRSEAAGRRGQRCGGDPGPGVTGRCARRPTCGTRRRASATRITARRPASGGWATRPSSSSSPPCRHRFQDSAPSSGDLVSDQHTAHRHHHRQLVPAWRHGLAARSGVHRRSSSYSPSKQPLAANSSVSWPRLPSLQQPQGSVLRRRTRRLPGWHITVGHRLRPACPRPTHQQPA